jgi:hypothetical protein
MDVSNNLHPRVALGTGEGVDIIDFLNPGSSVFGDGSFWFRLFALQGGESIPGS